MIRARALSLTAAAAFFVACEDSAHVLQLPGGDAGAVHTGCRNDGECAPLRCHGATGACVACTLDEHCASHLCDEVTLTCKGCTQDSDCRGVTPNCDVDDRRCVQCTFSAQCRVGEVCEGAAHACAARCRDDSDCAGTPRTICARSAGVCVQCNTNAQCSSPLPFCELREGSCVECLENTDCPDQHCSNEKQCHTCLSDLDCDLGQRCFAGDCRF